MQTVINILMVLCSVGFILVAWELRQQGKAMEWFSDGRNKRKFMKHFGSENINAFVDDVGNISLHLTVKGTCKEINLGYRNGLAIYRITKSGGIRKYLHKTGCI